MIDSKTLKKTATSAFMELKIGPYEEDELKVGPMRVKSLPFTAPWMSGLGACLINVTDIRRGDDGELEFQLADEDNKPYDDGTAWVKKGDFYRSWPK